MKYNILKTINILLLFFASALAFAQKSAVSPFKIEDYRILQHKYLDYADVNPQKVVKIEDEYYSTKKLDSLLLIKNKIKKMQMIDQRLTPEEIDRYSKELPDNVILPYAFFDLKFDKYNIRANCESVTLYNKKLKISAFNIHRTEESFSPFFIFETIEDFGKGIKTYNKYLPNEVLVSTYNENLKYKFRTRQEKEFDKKGNVILEKDWDKGIDFGLQDLLKTYRKKITDYTLAKKDSLGNYYDHVIRILPKAGPEPKEDYNGDFFKIEKGEKDGGFFWMVYIASTIYFIFDTKKGEILGHKIIFYHG